MQAKVRDRGNNNRSLNHTLSEFNPVHINTLYSFMNSKEQSPFKKLLAAQLVKKFPSFYGTTTFITVF
jgi:hypothetical protein